MAAVFLCYIGLQVQQVRRERTGPDDVDHINVRRSEMLSQRVARYSELIGGVSPCRKSLNGDTGAACEIIESLLRQPASHTEVKPRKRESNVAPGGRFRIAPGCRTSGKNIR